MEPKTSSDSLSTPHPENLEAPEAPHSEPEVKSEDTTKKSFFARIIRPLIIIIVTWSLVVIAPIIGVKILIRHNENEYTDSANKIPEEDKARVIALVKGEIKSETGTEINATVIKREKIYLRCIKCEIPSMTSECSKCTEKEYAPNAYRYYLEISPENDPTKTFEITYKDEYQDGWYTSEEAIDAKEYLTYFQSLDSYQKSPSP